MMSFYRRWHFWTTVFFVFLYVFFHIKADFTFPIPWPDEAVFYYPTNNLYFHSTFLSPEINPNRVLFWMPHGFMYVYGFLFHFLGNGLATTRHISMVLMIINFLLLLKLLPKKYIDLIFIAGLVFISTNCIIAGNVARMEALQLTISLLGFVYLKHGRYLLAISILLLGLLVHPAGVFLLFSGVAYIIFYKHNIVEAKKFDYIILTVIILICFAYLYYLSLHLDDVKMDFYAQINTRKNFSFLENLAQFNIFICITGCLLLLVISFVAYKFRNQRPGLLFILGATLIVIRLIGRSFWYNCYSSLGILLICISFYPPILDFLNHKISKPIYSKLILSILIIIFLIFTYVVKIPISNNVQWQGMYIDYTHTNPFTISRKKEIINQLKLFLSTDNKLKIYFVPEGDGVLFEDQLPNNWIHFFPIFNNNKPDYYLIHHSPHLGNTYREKVNHILKTKKHHLIFSDKEDKWYLAEKI